MVIRSLRSLKCVKPNYKGVWKVLVVGFKKWKWTNSHSLFNTTKGTKKVEAEIPGGDANEGTYRCLF